MYKLTFYSPLEVYNHPLESFLNCRPTCFLVICADKEREGNSGSNRTHPLCAQSNLPLQVGPRVNLLLGVCRATRKRKMLWSPSYLPLQFSSCESRPANSNIEHRQAWHRKGAEPAHPAGGQLQTGSHQFPGPGCHQQCRTSVSSSAGRSVPHGTYKCHHCVLFGV